MTPHDQLVLHDPDDPHRMGDCLRAAVASLLDLDPADVPHFVQEGYHAGDTDNDGTAWYDLLRGFLRSRGYDILWPVADDADEYRRWSALDHCIVTGPSPRGPFSHSVVGRLDGTVVHDPHPSRDGIAGPPTSLAFLCDAALVAA